MNGEIYQTLSPDSLLSDLGSKLQALSDVAWLG